MTQPTRIIAALRARLNQNGRAWMFGFVPGDRNGEHKLRYGVFRPRGDHIKGTLVITTEQGVTDDPAAAGVRTAIDAEAARVRA